MSTPNESAHVVDLKSREPQKWKDAHTGNAHTEDFVRQLAAELHAEDAKWGLVGQRGDPKVIADDALCYKDPQGVGHDPTDGNAPRTVVDFIIQAGSPSATPGWQVFTDPVADAGPVAWVAPTATPVVPSKPLYPPYPGDSAFDPCGQALFADFATAQQSINYKMSCWYGRTMYDWLVGIVATIEASVIKHQPEWRQALNEARVQQGQAPISW